MFERYPTGRQMEPNIVYFDLETQQTIHDVGGPQNLGRLRMSVGVTYSTGEGGYRIYPETELDDLVEELVRADLVVGYNLLHFDYGVLMGHTLRDLRTATLTLDLSEEIERVLGHRLKLDQVTTATLGTGKTGHGLDAIRWFREGKILEVARYCCHDVKVVRLLHEHVIRERSFRYVDRQGQTQTVEIEWSIDAAAASRNSPNQASG